MDDSTTKTASGVNGQTKTHENYSHVCCGPVLKWITAWITVDYKNEIVQLLKLAVPVVVSELMMFLVGFISMVFCGHLGKTELAGVGMAIAVINITGISIGSGLASACDTLISQTYGSGNLKRVGVVLQRGVLILLLTCFPCWALLINTQPILLAVRQSPEVARLAQLYVMIFMPALPASFMFQLQGRYLQNQGIIWPQVITGAVGNLLNALINYIVLYTLDMGVAGSAAANAITQYSMAVFLYVYIRWRRLHEATWEGWSTECLQDWGPFMRIAIPSMFMMCLEWWLYEIGSFLAGVISETELAAQSVVYYLATLAYKLPLGFSVAASVRVGNALGAGNMEQAKLSAKVSFICTIILSVCVGTVLGVTKDVIGYIFTPEQDVVTRVSDVMIMYGFIHLSDALSAVTGGVVRGAGKQIVGALSHFIGHYVIGFPIGVALMFPVKMGIVGLWLGFFTSNTLLSIFLVVYLCKLDWRKATTEALEIAGVPIAERKEMFGIGNKRPSIIPQEEILDTVSDSLTSQKAVMVSGVRDTGQGEDVAAATKVRVSLSCRQLVVRRGLTLVAMLLVLAAGIFVDKLVTWLLQRGTSLKLMVPTQQTVLPWTSYTEQRKILTS